MGSKVVLLNGGNRHVEKKTGILYNDTIERFKGCGAAWQRVCFGYKMSRVQILSSLPITAPLSSNEESIQIDSNCAESFIFMKLFMKLQIRIYAYKIKQNKMDWGQKQNPFFFTVFSRKRSQFSSVERGSPKPDVVGSNPTERDFFFVDRIRLNHLHSIDLLEIKEGEKEILN